MDLYLLLAKRDFAARATESSLFPFPFSWDCVGKNAAKPALEGILISLMIIKREREKFGQGETGTLSLKDSRRTSFCPCKSQLF